MKLVKLMILTILFFAASISAAKRPCTEEEFVRITLKGLPVGSAPIIRRIVECNHWGSEVGDTSPERTKQIEEGVKKAKCDTIATDQAAFIKFHAKSKKLENVFSKADAWDGNCD